MKLKPSFSAIWFSTSWVGICFPKNRGKFFQLGKWKPHKGQKSFFLENHFNVEAGLFEYYPDLHDGLARQRDSLTCLGRISKWGCLKKNPECTYWIGQTERDWDRAREYVLPIEVGKISSWTLHETFVAFLPSSSPFLFFSERGLEFQTSMFLLSKGPVIKMTFGILVPCQPIAIPSTNVGRTLGRPKPL